jgi:magnesium transporter
MPGETRPERNPAESLAELGQNAAELGQAAFERGARAGALTLRRTLQAIAGRSRKAGQPAGTLLHIGERRTDGTAISAITFSTDSMEETQVRPGAVTRLSPPPGVTTWYRVQGLGDVATIDRLGAELDLHPLLVEDALDTSARPKTDDYRSATFVSMKLVTWDPAEERIEAEHVSIVVGEDFMVSFQESGDPIFANIEERLRTPGGRIRAQGADHLAYTLLDTVVDGYFAVLEQLGIRIELIEERLLADTGGGILRDLHALRRELIFVRNAVWPLREVISRLERGDSPLSTDETRPYLRDVYDHAVEVIELIEMFRDLLESLVDQHMSNINNRTNEIMKVLTVLASIFIPITFLTGLYGMNFVHMPGLESRAGFPIMLSVMASVSFGLLGFFRLRRWI